MITANVDCSDKSNVTQARYEAHLCASDTDKAAWFNKWAEALLEDNSERIDVGTTSALHGIANEIDSYISELTDLAQEIRDQLA